MRIYTGKNTGVKYYHSGHKINGVSAALIEAAATHVVTEGKEQFIIEHSNGNRTACNLKCLNCLVNELHKDVKILANCYQEHFTYPVRVSWRE